MLQRSLLLSGLWLAGSGCAVTHPMGYDRLVASGVPQTIHATPGKMFGCAPWSYDLPDERRAIVRFDSGESTFDERFAFEVRAGRVRLACEAGGEVARLACDTEGGGFALGTGPACAPLDRVDFATTPSCWRGELADGSARYQFDYATMPSLSAPIARVSWHDPESGRTVQAYEGIVDMQVRLYHEPGVELEPHHADMLTASALALHFWKHTQYCD